MSETSTTSPDLRCDHCGRPIAAGALICPACGWLTQSRRLAQLSMQAQQLESTDRHSAIALWRQCLDLLPPSSQQYQMVLGRVTWLAQGGTVHPMDYAPPPPQSDTWASAVAKTGGSMILNIVVYGLAWGWQFATGFTILILIHEMGHVIAMRYYGIKGSPPIFIPFMGALINLRGSPKNAKEEAIIGMGGPLLGSIGALASYLLAQQVHDPTMHLLLIRLSFFGFFLNLFNLLPVPPMDGGRITAAISPWIWMPGILALGGLFVMILIQTIQHGGSSASLLVIGLMLFYAVPRVWHTLAGGGRHGEYFRIGAAASWSIAAVYVLLALSLIGLLLLCQTQLPPQFS